MAGRQLSPEKQRLFPRFKQRLTVCFCTSDSQWHTGLTHNISPRGLFVVCRNPLPAGTMLQVEVHVPVVGMVSVVGHVTWVRNLPAQILGVERTGIGVELENAPEAWFRLCSRLETK